MSAASSWKGERMNDGLVNEAASRFRAIAAVVSAALIIGSLLLAGCGGDDMPPEFDASGMDGSGFFDGSGGDDGGETDADTPIDSTVPPRDSSDCLGIFGTSIFGTACFGD